MHGPSLAQGRPNPRLAATCASPQPTQPLNVIFIPEGQSRRPGRPHLAPRSPPRPHLPLPKSASTTTGESVPALTAGVVTCASSHSVEASTRPCTVLAGACLPGRHDYYTTHPSPSSSPSPSPHLITPLTRYTQPFPPTITPINVRLLASLIHSGDPTLCVVAALDWHIAGRPQNAGLLFMLHLGGALTRSKLNSLVKELALRCGVAQGRYTSHSFRIGAASTAAAAGIPDWKVQALGRWNSQCYLRYIRVSPEGPDGVAAAMAGSPL